MAKKRITTDDYAQGLLGVGKEVVGVDRCYDALEHSALLKGIPVPSIALQWLINSNVWPLQRTTQSGGAAKTFKSTFSHLLASWWLKHGGTVVILDTEGKLSGETMEGMIGDKELMARYKSRGSYIFARVDTLEEWQSIITNGDTYRKQFNPDDVPPTLYIVDSLQGCNSKAASEELYEEGHGVALSRNGQLVAKQNHQFMRNMSKLTAVYPVNVHLISQELDGENHAKIRGGGAGPDFQATLDIKFQRGGVSAYNKSFNVEPGAGKEGANIRFRMRYNAIGPDSKDRELVVPVLRRFEKDSETGKNVSLQFYDWGAADAHFLWVNAKKIKSVLDIGGKYVQGKGLKCWSSHFGTDEQSSMDATTFGLLVQHDAELMAKLRTALHVSEHPEVALNENGRADYEYTCEKLGMTPDPEKMPKTKRKRAAAKPKPKPKAKAKEEEAPPPAETPAEPGKEVEGTGAGGVAPILALDTSS